MKKGKFIVIDGTDGSGKGTQTELLVEYLKGIGTEVEIADFPRYGNPSAGFVEKYLQGGYGTLEDVSAKKASILYALDRFDASADLQKHLDEGKWVVSNRYVSANMGHQTGKIKGPKERDEFLEWLDELEYGIFGIPRPDVQILLYVPPEIGQAMVDEKAKEEYRKGKKRDIHEDSLQHLQDAAEAYQYVAKKFNWLTIDCAPENKLLSREAILKMIVDALSDTDHL